MNISRQVITVAEIDVEIIRKNIKNLHLAVYPPEGHVRIAVPNNITEDNVRLAIVSRLAWIKRQQLNLLNQPRQSEREFVSGESHYFRGQRYLLEVIERHGKHEVKIKNNSKILLYVNPGTSRVNREIAVNQFYRSELKRTLPNILDKWEPIVGKKANFWGIKKMKTKWGSCNISQKRIWLNLELAKKTPECLEYIVVHELVHLLERHHNNRFKSLMDGAMPQWRLYRDILKSEPLAHEDWKY